MGRLPVRWGALGNPHTPPHRLGAMITPPNFSPSRILFSVLITGFCILAATPGAAQMPSTFYAAGSDIFVQFMGGDAAASSELWWLSAMGDPYADPFLDAQMLFSHDDPTGSVAAIDHTFDVGDEVLFGLYVPRSETWFYSGPGTRNPDGIAHVAISPVNDPTYDATGGWEDMANGDRDYNDLVFRFSGASSVAASTVPEPAAFQLLILPLLGLLFVRFRRPGSISSK